MRLSQLAALCLSAICFITLTLFLPSTSNANVNPYLINGILVNGNTKYGLIGSTPLVLKVNDVVQFTGSSTPDTTFTIGLNDPLLAQSVVASVRTDSYGNFIYPATYFEATINHKIFKDGSFLYLFDNGTLTAITTKSFSSATNDVILGIDIKSLKFNTPASIVDQDMMEYTRKMQNFYTGQSQSTFDEYAVERGRLKFQKIAEDDFKTLITYGNTATGAYVYGSEAVACAQTGVGCFLLGLQLASDLTPLFVEHCQEQGNLTNDAADFLMGGTKLGYALVSFAVGGKPNKPIDVAIFMSSVIQGTATLISGVKETSPDGIQYVRTVWYYQELGEVTVLIGDKILSAPQKQLTINSVIPVSGIPITVSPIDINGSSDGITSLTRFYRSNAQVTLKAPLTSNGYNFSAWSGCTNTGGLNGSECYVTMDGSKTVTVTYQSNPVAGHDVGIVNFSTSKESVSPGGRITLTANVKNYGIYTENNLPVTLSIKSPSGVSTSYAETWPSLDPNTSARQIQHTFNVDQPVGMWEASVSATLAIDANQSNNFMKKSFFVGSPPTYSEYKQYNAEIIPDGQSVTIGSGYTVTVVHTYSGRSIISVTKQGYSSGNKTVNNNTWQYFDQNKFILHIDACEYGSNETWITPYEAVPGTYDVTPASISVEAGSTATFHITKNIGSPYVTIINGADMAVVDSWNKAYTNLNSNKTEFDLNISVPINATQKSYDFWLDPGNMYIQIMQLTVLPPHNITVSSLGTQNNQTQYKIGDAVTLTANLSNSNGYDEQNVIANLEITGPNNYKYSASTEIDLLKGETKTTSFLWDTSFTDTGSYTVVLTGSFAWVDRDPTDNFKSINLSLTSNNQPTATASLINPQNSYNIGDTVYLRGIGTDIDNDTIYYIWSIIQKPSDSIASITSPNLQDIVFIPDASGSYTLQLQTYDGRILSKPSQVKINITSLVTPLADANGTISPWFPQPLDRGSSATFAIQPNDGYKITNLVRGTCPVGRFNGNYYTTGPIITNCTVGISFEQSAYSLNVEFNGDGGGSINSSPSGIACSNGTGTCNSAFPVAAKVRLSETESIAPCSLFSGWSEASCGQEISCEVTMTENKLIKASFAKIMPVKVVNTSYSTLFEAYQNAPEGAPLEIFSHSTIFVENLNFNRNVTLILRSGRDCSFATTDGLTAINGVLTVSRGTVTFENVIIY